MDREFARSGAEYIKALRKQLDARGHHSTHIIAGDVHSWAPATAMLADAELAAAVHVVCRHYPSTNSDPNAKKTGTRFGKLDFFVCFVLLLLLLLLLFFMCLA